VSGAFYDAMTRKLEAMAESWAFYTEMLRIKLPRMTQRRKRRDRIAYNKARRARNATKQYEPVLRWDQMWPLLYFTHFYYTDLYPRAR